MKLQHLTIHNIASIIDAEVDFDKAPLTLDPIFLITGETGAGKTTILNAICLALYNQVPSLESLGSKEKDRTDLSTKDPQQLMRRGTGEAWVELSFIGNDGRHYTSTWLSRRARSKAAGKLQPLLRALKIEEDNDHEYRGRDVDPLIQNAVGLTFDQFTRTTLLAQGQFSTFMKAKDTDKSEILEKLTGTEIYATIGQRVFALFQAKAKEHDDLANQIKGANLLSDEQKEQLSLDIITARDRAAELEPKLKQLDQHIKWLEQLASLQGSIKQAKEKLEAISLAPVQDGLSWLAHQIEEHVAKLKETQQKIETEKPWVPIYENSQRIEQISRTIAAETKKEKNHRNERKLLLAEIALSRKSEDQLAQNQKAAQEAFDAQLGVSEALREELRAHDLQLLDKAYEEASAALQQWVKTKETAEAFAKATQESNEAEANLAEAQNNLEKAQANLKAQEKQLPEATERHAYCDGILQGQMELNDHIASLRARFAQQKECPLCGSHIDSLRDDSELNTILEKAKAEANQAKADLERITNEIAKTKAEIKVLAKHAQQCATKHGEKAKALADAEEKAKKLGQWHLNPEFDAILTKKIEEATQEKDQRHQALKIARDKHQAYQKAQVATDELRAAKEAAEKKLRNHQDAIREKEQRATQEEQLALNSSQAAIQALVQMQQLMPDWPHEITAENASATSKDIAARAKKYAEMLKQKDDEAQKIDLLKLTATSCKTALEPLSSYLRPEYAPTPTEHRNLEKEIADLSALINQYKGSIANDSDKIAALTEKIAQELPEDLTLDSLKEAKETEKNNREQAIRAMTAAETHLKQNARLEAALADKRKTLEKLAQERNDWQLLNDAFGGADGKKFRNMAQSYVLRALLGKANYYLRMLSSRYELDCDDGSLTINVIDANQDHAVRNVGLLSGGESFIVSLALALGLSAISKDQLQVDTLFIDEGFGTLDADTLEVVINTLDRLHQVGGRRIGIISHVAELKERIPTQIQLVRASASSSKIVIR